MFNNYENKIIFAAVDEKYKAVTNDNGIMFFPNIDSLRKFRFGRKDVISLNEVADPDCKKCLGTGKRGKDYFKKMDELLNIYGVLTQYISTSPEIIPDKIIEVMQLPPNLKRPLDMLIQLALKELSDDNHKEVSQKYAKIIKKDFNVPRIIWCDCFLKNLQKKIEDTMRQLKFSIN